MSGKSAEAGFSQAVFKCFSKEEQYLGPVFFVLAYDIFDIVFINKRILFHDGSGGCTIHNMTDDFLLVGQGSLGVWNNRRKRDSMGHATIRAPHSLHGKGDKFRHEFDTTGIVPVADETAFTATGTFFI